MQDFPSFVEYYNKTKKTKGTSKQSEPYFRELIRELIHEHGTVDNRHYRIKLNKPPLTGIEKRIDIRAEIYGKTTLIELKKNIDVVEKDLFKFQLLTLDGNMDRKTLIVWEETPKKGQYRQLIEFAIKQGWLDTWFYIHLENYKTEVQRLQKWLLE
jgi:hypothetical protein